MSSWRKASKSGQREHRERHQPESRKEFGFLEKKKDYKQRARAYEVKKNKLKKLQKKALNRNPDEFHFHMINSEIKDGFHYEKEKAEEFTEPQLKLMQTQDIRYVAYKQSMEAKKIEKLKAGLHMLESEDKPQNTHTFFVESEKKKYVHSSIVENADEVKERNNEKASQKLKRKAQNYVDISKKQKLKTPRLVKKEHNFDIASHLQTDPSLLSKSYNRPTLQSLKKFEKQGMKLSDYSEEIKKLKRKQYHELSKRIERERELSILCQKLDVKKKLVDKKNPPLKKVAEGTKTTPATYVWKKERKR